MLPIHTHTHTSVDEDEALLASIDTRLRALELEQAIIQEKRISLSQSKQKLAANIVAKQVYQAPMRTLLPELCAEIFSYCVLGEDGRQLRRHTIWSICAPALLSSVCRRWRDMVIHNPLLWTNLCICLDDRINHTARVKLWATRSQSLPLHITLQPSTLPPATGIPDTLLQRFLHAVRWLSQHLHRTKTLAIEPGIPVIPILLSDGTPPAMPYLRSLILDTDDKDNANIVQCTLVAPLLREVRVRDLTSMARVLQRTLEHLTVLVITYSRSWSNPAVFGIALSSCIRLVECTITFPSEPFSPPPDPILLPEVQRLEIRWRHHFDPATIAGTLRAPKLDHLVLAHDANLSASSRLITGPLKELFISAPALRRLTLSHCALGNWYDLSTVLVEARNLSQLEIFKCQRGSLFIMGLTPQSGEHPATWSCPRIRRLSIDSFDKWDMRPILDFVKKRMYNGEGREIPQTSEYSFLEELELPRSLSILDFQSRVYMRSQLRDLAASGRVRILGAVVG